MQNVLTKTQRKKLKIDERRAKLLDSLTAKGSTAADIVKCIDLLILARLRYFESHLKHRQEDGTLVLSRGDADGAD